MIDPIAAICNDASLLNQLEIGDRCSRTMVASVEQVGAVRLPVPEVTFPKDGKQTRKGNFHMLCFIAPVSDNYSLQAVLGGHKLDNIQNIRTDEPKRRGGFIRNYKAPELYREELLPRAAIERKALADFIPVLETRKMNGVVFQNRLHGTVLPGAGIAPV